MPTPNLNTAVQALCRLTGCTSVAARSAIAALQAQNAVPDAVVRLSPDQISGLVASGDLPPSAMRRGAVFAAVGADGTPRPLERWELSAAKKAAEAQAKLTTRRGVIRQRLIARVNAHRQHVGMPLLDDAGMPSQSQ